VILERMQACELHLGVAAHDAVGSDQSDTRFGANGEIIGQGVPRSEIRPIGMQLRGSIGHDLRTHLQVVAHVTRELVLDLGP
jgi:hypothetical protein